MNATVTIPIWVLLLLLGIAAWAMLDRILIPSTRWFLRRRVNRVIDEISTRLDIKIKPFQLTKRQVLIDRLVYDPRIVEAIQATAREKNCPREVVQSQVVAYAREIVPAFNAYLYFRIGYWLAKKIARMLYHVHISFIDEAQFATIDPESTVVFVINHRSNMDYVLVAFLAAEKTALSYAVGEWARIWPLQTLIRALGAFFVRRNSGEPLYRRVLERYIHMATREGVCQAVFLEGGLSRDGRLRPPRLGYLDYMLRGFDPEQHRDIVFIPVGVNYDRTLEDRSLLRELDPEAERRSRWFVIKTTAGFIGKSLMLMAASRWQRFGYAAVTFGRHVSVREYCRGHRIDFSKLDRAARFKAVEKLAGLLAGSIQNVIPVLPVSLVATILLQARQEGLSAVEIQARAAALTEKRRQQGAPVQLLRQDPAPALAMALNMLQIRRLVREANGRYTAVSGEKELLSYYANAIAHWQLPAK